MNHDLAAIVRIKHIAQTAAQVDQRMTLQKADETARAYDRLRNQAGN
jgi:hypothetical protein